MPQKQEEPSRLATNKVSNSECQTRQKMSSPDIDYPSVPNTSIEEIEENFLRSCRNGDLGTVKQFLAYRDAKKVDFDISCKGRSKYNGWTPLHLATYFGHRHVVEHLLSRNADVNAINENGDTALHKAAFIGREVGGRTWSIIKLYNLP